MTPRALLAAWLGPHAWLDDCCRRIAEGDARCLYLALGQAGRQVGRAPLPVDLAAAQAARPGWDPRGWSRDQAARALLVLALPPEPVEAWYATLERCFVNTTLEEQVALYQALPLLPHPDRLVARAAAGVRSSAEAVVAAVALDNPYPAEWLPDPVFHHLVLKCVFLGLPTARIVGLERRRHPELGRMLAHFVLERRLARRPVADEVVALARACGATVPEPAPELAMDELLLIDPHIHMSARTTDDYEAMRAAGIRAVIEPAFWLGQPRTSLGTFVDYFASLTGWERFRAGQFGVRHYCAIGLNSKEANDEALAAEVLEVLPLWVAKDGVVAVGEIGFDEQTPAEERAFRAQLELAREAGLPVMVHTPHRDKLRGTLRSLALCREHGLPPEQVVIDHNTEETVQAVLESGCWAAFTLYPRTKMGSERMVEIVRRYGGERIIADSSADWGVSDPLAVPKTARLMLERGIARATVEQVCYRNAIAAYRLDERDWLAPPPVDQRVLFCGNSVLRGQAPRTPGGVA